MTESERIANMSPEELERECERAAKERVIEEDAKKAVEIITRHVNYSCRNGTFEKAFIEQLTCRTHRTLQQSTARLLVELFREWAAIGAKGEGHYDDRNQDTIKFAQKLMKMIEEESVHLSYV